MSGMRGKAITCLIGFVHFQYFRDPRIFIFGPFTMGIPVTVDFMDLDTLQEGQFLLLCVLPDQITNPEWAA